MKTIFIALLITIISHSLLFSQVNKTSEPHWIDSIDYQNSEINEDDIVEGAVILLYDSQIHLPTQITYTRLTTKITDNVGVQNASNVTIVYDPTYQTLNLHKVNIIRDGKVLNKLDVNNFQVMRRELNAENFLYDGSLSAVMNISDVRTGDIIDYSYSIIGFNPIHNNTFSNSFYLNDFESVGQINNIVLSDKKLNYKLFNNAIAPNITSKDGLTKYHWNVKNTTRVEFEQNTPSWKLLYDMVCLSGYNSWEDVVNWGLEVYTINQKTDAGLLDKINEINTKHENPGDKIKATLDFVQNEIRYLGLESGIGGYKPFSPNHVFEKRFGDCKDKSLLMATMLHSMGINAYPMLVNTYLKQTINDLLPSPKFFDHCVVKVENSGRNYYYDPTISNQGGDYALTYFPDYKYGLVLKEGNAALDEIKSNAQSKVETIEEYTIDTIGKGAKLKVKTTYHESEADNIRNYFKNNSLNTIKKEYENFYSSYYFNVSSENPPVIKDNKYSNKFEVFEEYKIDSIWKPMTEKDNHIAATFSATSISNLLYIPTKDQRNNSVSIIYPIIREHKIKVNLPSDWGIKNEKLYVNSPGFYYEWKVDYNKKQKSVNLYYYLATQKDHITINEYQQYIQDVKKVQQSTGYYLFVPENYSGKTIDSNLFLDGIMNIFKFLLFLALVVVVVLFIFWKINKNKKII